MRRIAPAVSLLLIAPAIGEFLLGNLPLSQLSSLGAYPVLAMLYGSGAVLIREIVRRTGRGYPTMIGLAVAYGVLEEGIVTQSLFNPNFQGLDLHAYGGIATLGIGLPWTLFVLTIHSVWSIVVPIALVEALFQQRRHDRWLNTPGAIGLVLLYLVGFAALCLGTIYSEDFVASAWQLAGSLVIAAAIGVLALRLPQPPSRSSSRVWAPIVLTAFTFLAGSVYFLSYQLGSTARLFPAPFEVVVSVAVLAVSLGGIFLQSRRSGWNDQHRFAVVTGAILTYCWAGFLVQFSQYGLQPIGTLVQIGLVAGAATLLVFAARNVKTS